jgi:hypothetical protein
MGGRVVLGAKTIVLYKELFLYCVTCTEYQDRHVRKGDGNGGAVNLHTLHGAEQEGSPSTKGTVFFGPP